LFEERVTGRGRGGDFKALEALEDIIDAEES